MKNTLKYVAAFSSLLALAPVAQADWLIEDEKITDIRLGPWNTDSFAIKTTNVNASDPENPCGGQWVVFLRDQMDGPDAYDRAYALVLSAMTANQPVIVVGSSASCASAVVVGFIR